MSPKHLQFARIMPAQDVVPHHIYIIIVTQMITTFYFYLQLQKLLSPTCYEHGK